jgi:hypothetical protein
MAKTCPICGAPMTPTYIWVKEAGKLIRKLYAWICTKCSHSVPA